MLGATIISGVTGILIRNRAFVILLFFTAGFLSATWVREEYSIRLSRIEETAAETGHLRVYGVPDPDISYSYGRYRFLLHSDSIKGLRENLGKNIKFRCSSRKKPQPDSRVIVQGYYTPPSEPLLPGGYNEHLYSLNRKLYGKIYTDSTKVLSSTEVNSGPGLRLSRLIIETCSKIKNYKVRSILKAVTTGQKRDLPESLSQSFRQAGIYHILALSGLHIAIITCSLLLILSILPCTQTVKNLIVTLLLWMYLAFIGFIPSLFRAVLMASMILCSVCLQRRNTSLNSLGAAGAIWLLLSPHSLYLPGFQLSFAATLGIVLIFPVLRSEFIRPEPIRIHEKILSMILNLFFITLSATAGIFPVAAYHFGRTSLYVLLNNLYSTLLMTISIDSFMAGLLINSLIPVLAGPFLFISEHSLLLLIKGAELTSTLRFSDIPVSRPGTFWISVYTIFFLYLSSVKPAKLRTLLLSGAVLLFYTAPVSIITENLRKETRVTLIHRNNKAITGIRYPENETVLILPQCKTDCRSIWDEQRLMLHHKTRVIDYLIITEPSINSMHKLIMLNREYKIRNIITTGLPEDKGFKKDLQAFLDDHSITKLTISSGALILGSNREIKCMVLPKKVNGCHSIVSTPELLICTGERLYLSERGENRDKRSLPEHITERLDKTVPDKKIKSSGIFKQRLIKGSGDYKISIIQD